MKQKAAAGVLGVLAIVQLVLHCLGWLGILGAIVAFLFGRSDRAVELVVGGVGFIVLKYVLGFIVLNLLGLGKDRASEHPPQQ